MKLEDKALFMGSHAPSLEAGVEVVHPSQPAALAGPVEPCMEGDEGRRRPVSGDDTRRRCDLAIKTLNIAT
jgi:hypothetical protein